MDDLYDFIGNRILQLCQRKGISLKSLSKTLGKSSSYVSRVVAKRIKIPAYVVVEICNYFGISMNEFFDESCCAPDLVSTALKILIDLEDRDLDTLYNLVDRIPKQMKE